MEVLNTKDATRLRSVNRELRYAVAAYPWYDKTTRIPMRFDGNGSNVARWRACFPHARAANISNNQFLCDEDFQYLHGLKWLDIGFGTSFASPNYRTRRLSDAAFAHLEGLGTLRMLGRDEVSITDRAFAHLKSLKVLDITRCNQFTDAALEHVAETLVEVTMCHTARFTDSIFAHLKHIKALDISFCRQLTDETFECLDALVDVKIAGCNRITDRAFAKWRHCRRLDMNGCNQESITDAAFQHLGSLVDLDMGYCTQSTITDRAFEHLKSVRKLNMNGCTQPTITSRALESLKGLELLWRIGCKQFRDQDIQKLRDGGTRVMDRMVSGGWA